MSQFAVFGAAGIAEDGGLLDFFSTEVKATQKICENAQTSILVIDGSKFGRQAPALGDNIVDINIVIVDRPPNGAFAPLMKKIKDRLHVAEGEST